MNYLNSHTNFRERIITNIYAMGEITLLLVEIFKCSMTRPFYFKRLAEQIHILGLGSIPITLVIGLTMGFVMTLNFGYGLAKFGGTMYVPAIVSLSLARELAPVFTSLLVAGRIGSGMAAELGSMSVTQQVDALKALGTSPLRVLVVPRFWASIISLPLLSTLALTMGILGGLIICMSEFDIPAGFYFSKASEMVKVRDFISGLVKSMLFGGIISLCGCYRGLKTQNGTRGVGHSTIWVVVTSSIVILFTDFLVSKIFLAIWVKQ